MAAGSMQAVASPDTDRNKGALHARSHIGIKKYRQVSIKLTNPVV